MATSKSTSDREAAGPLDGRRDHGLDRTGRHRAAHDDREPLGGRREVAADLLGGPLDVAQVAAAVLRDGVPTHSSAMSAPSSSVVDVGGGAQPALLDRGLDDDVETRAPRRGCRPN